jgi:hypothetical protein
VKYRERLLKTNPNDFHAQLMLGEAYILNSEFGIAIEYLTSLHSKMPDDEEVQHLILDVLFALGKNENDFIWEIQPIIIDLNITVLNECYDCLRGKRKGRTVSDLYCSLMSGGYLKFDENELLQSLEGDNRFLIDKDPLVGLSLVRTMKRINNE